MLRRHKKIDAPNLEDSDEDEDTEVGAIIIEPTDTTKSTRRDTTKILNNSYNKLGVDYAKINFQLDSLFDTNDIEEQVHTNMIMEQIHDLIINSKFVYLTQAQEKKKAIKKHEYNELFQYISENTNMYILDLFFALSYYLDVQNVKLFDILSCVYKDKVLKLLLQYNKGLYQTDISLY